MNDPGQQAPKGLSASGARIRPADGLAKKVLYGPAAGPQSVSWQRQQVEA